MEPFFYKLTASGTGITLYAASANDTGINLNVTLDGQSNATTISVNDTDQTYNILFYDTQSLRYDNHIVTVLILDSRGGPSHFGFDYAVVNDTIPVSSPPTASTSPASSSRSRLVTKLSHKFGMFTTA